jgi:hypothetical protein
MPHWVPICIYMYIYIHAHIYIYIHVYVCMYVYTYIYIYIYIYTCIHIYIYIHIEILKSHASLSANVYQCLIKYLFVYLQAEILLLKPQCPITWICGQKFSRVSALVCVYKYVHTLAEILKKHVYIKAPHYVCSKTSLKKRKKYVWTLARLLKNMKGRKLWNVRAPVNVLSKSSKYACSWGAWYTHTHTHTHRHRHNTQTHTHTHTQCTIEMQQVCVFVGSTIHTHTHTHKHTHTHTFSSPSHINVFSTPFLMFSSSSCDTLPQPLIMCSLFSTPSLTGWRAMALTARACVDISHFSAEFARLGLGFRVQGLGFWVLGLGSRV